MKDVILYRGKNTAGQKRVLPVTVGFLLVVFILCVVCAVTWFALYFMSDDVAVSAPEAMPERQYPVIVIDAGHGGIDGGAVGADGSLEKDINLSLSKKIAELFRIADIDCIMTRTDDHMLADENMKSHRKMHDLKNRLAVVAAITDSGREAVLLSIHMNNFSSPEYSGLQVWYSPNSEESVQLASSVQEYARQYLNPDNNRKIKPATSAIYMLDRATVPAILIECGFLSNFAECTKLSSAEYQSALALAIFAAAAEWLSVA